MMNLDRVMATTLKFSKFEDLSLGLRLAICPAISVSHASRLSSLRPFRSFSR